MKFVGRKMIFKQSRPTGQTTRCVTRYSDDKMTSPLFAPRGTSKHKKPTNAEKKTGVFIIHW